MQTMSLEAQTYEFISSTLTALQKCRDEGVLTEDDYYKSVVALSANYITIGDVDAMFGLLCAIPSEYYILVQPDQMVEDPDYAEIAFVIARILMESNAFSFEESVLCTQGRGEA